MCWGDPRVAPGTLSVAPSREQGQRAAAVHGSSSCALRVSPARVPVPAGLWWPWELLLKPSRGLRCLLGAGSSSLSHNLQGQCVFPKGNWSRNGAGRRSCLGEIVNKSPDKQKSSFYCSSGNQSLGSRKHLFFFLEEQLHLVVPLMSCVLKPLIEPFPSGLDLP